MQLLAHQMRDQHSRLTWNSASWWPEWRSTATARDLSCRMDSWSRWRTLRCAPKPSTSDREVCTFNAHTFTPLCVTNSTNKKDLCRDHDVSREGAHPLRRLSRQELTPLS